MRQSGAETLVTEEPYAFIAHVRVCGGADWVTIGSARKPTPNSLRSCVAPAIGRGSPPAFGCLRQTFAGLLPAPGCAADRGRCMETTMWLSTVAFSVILGLFLAPDPSYAQAVAKTPRIGMLTNAFDPHSGFEAFRQGLRDLGYVEGQSIALEYRFAEGKPERLPALAAELVRLKVDIIFT